MNGFICDLFLSLMSSAGKNECHRQAGKDEEGPFGGMLLMIRKV